MSYMVSLLAVLNRPNRWHSPRSYNSHTTNEETLGLF